MRWCVLDRHRVGKLGTNTTDLIRKIIWTDSSNLDATAELGWYAILDECGSVILFASHRLKLKVKQALRSRFVLRVLAFESLLQWSTCVVTVRSYFKKLTKWFIASLPGRFQASHSVAHGRWDISFSWQSWFSLLFDQANLLIWATSLL